MAAVIEESATVNEVESEKTVEELKIADDTTVKTDNNTVEDGAEKTEQESEEKNGVVKENAEGENEQKTEQNNEETANEKKEENVEKSEEKPLGATVAKHYNDHPEGTKDSRKSSRIFYMRNFNNWVKSVIINEFLYEIKRFNYRNIHVLDLCCGKGGDLLKWQKGRIRKLVCADIAKVSVDQCKERYCEMKKTAEERRYRDPLFDPQFIVADCSKERLAEKYEDKDLVFDLTSCQFSFHYSFESYEQADMMLKNACERLKPGGYFVGTTTNAYELVKRVKQAEGLEFGNDVYKIAFESKDSFPLYGCKYDFKLDGAVDCPEFLLYFPVLERMAKKYSMKLLYVKPFHDFFKERGDANMALINRMNALETYPARHEGEKLISQSEDSYSHAKDFMQGLQSGKTESPSSRYRDHRDRSPSHVKTLSKEEWEAVGMYVAFAFVKVDRFDDDVGEKKPQQENTETPAEGESSNQPESRKRRHDDDTTADEPPAKKLDEQAEDKQEADEAAKPEDAQQETNLEQVKPDEAGEVSQPDSTQDDSTQQDKKPENME